MNNIKKHLCDANDSCLIIIDIQEKLTPAIPEKVTNRILVNASILLAAAKRLAVPVITTTQYPQGLGEIEEAIINKLPESAANFEKTCFSCLGAEGFREHLKTLKRKQIILFGIEAHICILQSAFDLLAEGYDVFVIIDGVASRKAADYESGIMRMSNAGVTIVNTESVFFEWLRDASHPEFKPLSKLIL